MRVRLVAQCLTVWGVVVGPGLASAPQPAAPAAGQAVIGVRVLTRDGQPVAGLGPGDIHVAVDGRPVTVTGVDQQASEPAAAGAAPTRRLVLVINRPTVAAGGGRAMLEQVAAFFEQRPPAEYVAVWPLPAVRPQLVLTGDRAITRAALLAATGTRTASAGRFALSAQDAARIAGGDQMLLDTMAERECPAVGGNRDDVARCREEMRRDALTLADQSRGEVQQTARELQLLVGALGRAKGLKHVVVLSAGVGQLQEQASAVRAVAADAAAGGVTVHAIEMPHLAAGGARGRAGEPSFEVALARATGGLGIAARDVQQALSRLVQELAGEYQIVIAPEAALGDGRPHELTVKLASGAASVSAPQYLRLDPAGGEAQPPSPAQAPATPAPADAAPVAVPEKVEPPTADVPAPGEAAGPSAPAGEALASLPLPALLSKAADYSRRYEKTMATVVLEERYVQLLKRWAFPPKEIDAKRLAWLPGAGKPDRIDVNVYDRRQTRADLLLVQLPNERWAAFRDIFEVNGRELRGREDRLRKLFLQQTDDSHRQLHRINQTSADYNLGGFYREVNLPTVGLQILQAAYQSHFAFAAGHVDRVDDHACRQVTFTETGRPTLVRTRNERDVPLTGSACVDADGIVWRTRVAIDGRVAARGAIEVTYGRHDRVDVLVPISMWEWFLPVQQDDPRGPVYVEALATYSNLRQFSVTTSEDVR